MRVVLLISNLGFSSHHRSFSDVDIERGRGFSSSIGFSTPCFASSLLKDAIAAALAIVVVKECNFGWIPKLSPHSFK
jgi:hypothetical protein